MQAIKRCESIMLRFCHVRGVYKSVHIFMEQAASGNLPQRKFGAGYLRLFCDL